jgi:hypothetical protein
MNISVADEVWIAVATLHNEHPQRRSFSEREIKEQVHALAVHPAFRAGVQWHISLHCVANLPPNPARLRMLYKLPDGTYRLFRPGDDYDPRRTGRSCPERQKIPAKYAGLLDWYQSTYSKAGAGESAAEPDPVLAMRGVGKEVWANIDADAFIRELRSDPPEPIPVGARKPAWAHERTRG